MSSGTPLISTEKQTLIALRALRQRIEELESASREPIAIVGMGCQFPGASDGLDRYWDLLNQARLGIVEIPATRMALEHVFDPRPQMPGKTYSRSAGLVEAPGDFDAEFFGISRREATSLDPQQRLLLEVSWEALENACIDPRSLVGKDAGVFVGVTSLEYGQLLQTTSDRKDWSAYTLQGSVLNTIAGRLSYFYGLNGPCMAIDTACSSSLVAIDRACRSLREGETSMAIAAGVNILAIPETLIVMSQWGMLSPGGLVRSFDAGADGFVRGEGCGVVVLRRLSDAERSGDRILGVILGSSVNQDGASSGLTVPNGLAQQALLREAHRRSGIEAWQVGYVEAHGTGTRLGDPIEAEALGAVFGSGRARGSKLAIGSVKTNLGHLESAAGVAGLIKVVLGLEHGVIPGQLHWTGPSEHVRWSELPLEVVTESRVWEPIAGRRIGGVSSFGFSGTNAHVVVEGWDRREDAVVESGPVLEVLVVTSRTEAGLRALVERYAVYLETVDAVWSDVCYTASVGRGVFGERLAVMASDRSEAAAKLRDWLRSAAGIAGVYRGQVSAGRRGAGAALAGDAAVERVAAQFVNGGPIDWPGYWSVRSGGASRRRIALPTYAFQRERYWIEPGEGEASAEARAGVATGRGLLGHRLRSAGVQGQYETHLLASGWIGDHVVESRVVLPGTGHLELMLEAGAELMGPCCVVEDVVFQAPLVVEKKRRVQTVVEEAVAGRSRVRVYAERSGEGAEGEWERVSEGWLRAEPAASEAPASPDVDKIRSRLTHQMGHDAIYTAMTERGLGFGPRFRGLSQVWTGPAEALGEIVRTTDHEQGWELEPWWLDACLQAAGMAVQADVQEEDGALYLPMGLDRLTLYQAGRANNRTPAWSHATVRRIDPQTLTAQIHITNTQGHTLLHIQNIQFRKKIEKKKKTEAMLYEVEWIEAFIQDSEYDLSGNWLVLHGDDQLRSKLSSEIEEELSKLGATCFSHSGLKAQDDMQNTAYLSTGQDLDSVRYTLRRFLSSHGAIDGLLDLRYLKTISFSELDAADDDPGEMPELNMALHLFKGLLLEQIHPRHGIWLISKREQTAEKSSLSPAANVIHALRRTVALEFPELRINSIDLDSRVDAKHVVHAIAGIGCSEVMLCGERNYIPRLRNLLESSKRTSIEEHRDRELVPADSGLIEDLAFKDVDRTLPNEDEIEIQVQAHGVNFRDVMNSLGMLPGYGNKLGGECAGIVSRAGRLSGFVVGERAFAFARGGYRRYVTVVASQAAHVPEGLTASQAAALPVAYLTAIYGLERLAGLRPGESVLIHSAAGGLGLAAIYIARTLGADIYATAGSEEKRDYLRSLGLKNVLHSRTRDFADEVMLLTGGRGVDVALNSLTGNLAERTLETVKQHGRFLEVGKREALESETVQRIRPDVQHFKFDLGEEAVLNGSLLPSLMKKMVHLLESGAIPPLPIREFIEHKEAFRYMAQARHIGKISVVPKQRRAAPNSCAVDSEATYLITGGLGGLGLTFALDLVERGARNLILMGRNAPNIAAAQLVLHMRSIGAEVTVVCGDVAERNLVQLVFDQIPVSKPLKGILHAAGTIEDHGLLEHDSKSLLAVMRPKWHGAWNLHKLSQGLALEFFVLFSSASVILGSAGQANYACANAMLDCLAAYRRRLGLPASSIQWGPWKSVGMATRAKLDWQHMGIGGIDSADGLEIFETILRLDKPVVAAVPLDSWSKYMERRPPNSSEIFSRLLKPSPNGVVSVRVEEIERLPLRLLHAELPERQMLLDEHLRQQIGLVLSLPPEMRIDEDEALHDLGLDSLMAVELRNALAVSLGRQLHPTLVLDYPSLRVLKEFLLSEMDSAHKKLYRGDESLEEAAGMSEAEAEALLLEELGEVKHDA